MTSYGSQNQVFLSLGANIGDREFMLRKAVEMLTRTVGKVSKSSGIYETKSWGYTDADYLNSVLLMETNLSAFRLLEKTKSIEFALGRKEKTVFNKNRQKHEYKARPIDIDILFFNEDIIESKELTIPHPLIQFRAFVLVPIYEIAPDFTHPVLGKTINEMLNELSKTEAV